MSLVIEFDYCPIQEHNYTFEDNRIFFYRYRSYFAFLVFQV